MKPSAVDPGECIGSHDTKAKPSAQSLFKEFTESTTLHGISHVFGNGSKVRRLIWLICLLGSTAGFITATTHLFSSYFSFDVMTRVTLINKDYAIFPAVTICNFNPLRKDYLQQVNLTKTLSLFANVDNESNESITAYNTSMEDILTEGAHKMDKKNMLSVCTFQGRECGEEHFKPVFTRMGLCYTFNKDSDPSFARIQNPGDDFGLTLRLFAQQEQYYGVTSEIAGFKLHVHDPNEPALVQENGFAVMPGTCTFVAVTETRVKSLPAPYMTKCENKKLPGTTIYSKPLCYEECRASFIIKKCGCRDAEMQKMPNIPPCTFLQKTKCVLPQHDAFTRSVVKNCSCPKPCNVTSYETRLSYAQYPSEHVKKSLAKHFVENAGGNFSSNMEEHVYKYLGKNIVLIKIFLQDLNYRVVEDIPNYQSANLFAEIGGMMGLLLGASLITVVEFGDFLFCLFVNKCLK